MTQDQSTAHLAKAQRGFKMKGCGKGVAISVWNFMNLTVSQIQQYHNYKLIIWDNLEPSVCDESQELIQNLQVISFV